MSNITNLSQLDPAGTYSYADYLTWRFEERVELIRGQLVRLFPAPTVRHQQISRNILSFLWNNFKTQGCQVFHAPFDVRLYDSSRSIKANKDIFTVVQPDICIICDDTKLDERGCIGSPDWIIEIISPGTKRRDLTTKLKLYQANQVREYWIIHPGDCFVQTYFLTDEKYGDPDIFDYDELDEENRYAVSKLFPHIKIDLKEIFD